MPSEYRSWAPLIKVATALFPNVRQWTDHSAAEHTTATSVRQLGNRAHRTVCVSMCACVFLLKQGAWWFYTECLYTGCFSRNILNVVRVNDHINQSFSINELWYKIKTHIWGVIILTKDTVIMLCILQYSYSIFPKIML